MRIKEEKQLMQLEYLIREFYPESKVYQVDEVEERIYFIDAEGDDMQAVVKRDREEVQFQYLNGEDWYDADWVSFDHINMVNQSDIF